METTTLIPDNAILVLFGITGDLAKRKLLPAIYHLAEAGLLPHNYRIIGSAPPEVALSHDDFIEHVHASLVKFCHRKLTPDVWASFKDALVFVPSSVDDMSELDAAVAAAEAELGGAKRVFYLAVPPPAFIPMIEALGASKLVTADAKVVIEKPFGSNHTTACQLNEALHAVFDESQIYRIDHFLGKEAVQNILALRFANGFLEPSWCTEHLEYVQIDVPETLTLEGRGSFYEATGAFRDMIVTHLFQILGFLAMEAPDSFDAASLHTVRHAVFRDLQVLDPERAVFGQYDGYHDEPHVAADSRVETFVAIEARINNKRWNGVPFYLRTGKALAQTRSTVTLGFRQPSMRLFNLGTDESAQLPPNELVIELSDPGGLTVSFLAKQPGPKMVLEPAALTLHFADTFNVANQLDAYGRLLHDVLLGDPTLFNDAVGIERLWEVAEPLLAAPLKPVAYAQGSWGPEEAATMILPNTWHLSDHTHMQHPKEQVS